MNAPDDKTLTEVAAAYEAWRLDHQPQVDDPRPREIFYHGYLNGKMNRVPGMLPITSVAVGLPNGSRVCLQPSINGNYGTITGLKMGDVILSGAEIEAVRDILNMVYPPGI